ncbi:MAG: hypothetical protein R2828_25135 [Saprospiraceae bacterium]
MRHSSFCFILILGLVNALGGQSEASPLWASFEAYQTAKENSLFKLQWIPVGPVLNSARVESVQADPAHPGTMYAAFGSGNLWKTVNNGLSWKPMFENQAALGIGDIALAPSDPNIIYVGTGESLRKNRDFTMPGTGVYRSDDGGESWRHLGLDDAWHIGEISVHPQNPEIVFVAVMGKFWSESESMGVYRSQNGGKDWERVLFVDKNTRANDVVIAPSDPNIIYASMWENDLTKPLNESVYGPQSGIYRSADGGTTWARLDKGLPEGPKIGRIGLAVSYQNPDKVYALMDNRNNEKGDASEVYKTENGGKNWKRSHADPLMIFPGIGWYFADIYVNPQDDEEIFGLGVRMAHSADGGKSFDLVEGKVEHLHPSPAQTLHLDHCEMWINPLNPQHLVLGNDGGLYVSYDKGLSWLHLNNIPAGEFYDITLDNQEPYLIYGGTQDDATVFGPAKEWDNTQKDSWKYLWIDAWSGGDGCVTQVDPEDPNTIYFSMQHGALRRKDLAADSSKGIAPARQVALGDKLQYSFVTPYFISPHAAKTLYHAGNYVMKTMDRGDHWELISGDLSGSKLASKKEGVAGAIAESPLQAGLLYLGTNRGVFWTSPNDGADWEEHSYIDSKTETEALPIANIRSIFPSVHAVSRVYMAMTGLNDDDLNNYLFVSENKGETWTSLTANLPNEPANVILEDPVYEDILYAGLYRGVYVSINRGKSWFLLGDNLPAVSIGDLAVQERANDLVVATHGRGIYYLNLDPIHQAYQIGLPLSKDHLFPVPDGQSPKRRDTHRDIDESTLSKIPISFWMAEEGMAQFTLWDSADHMVWEYALKAPQGLNQFRWNMLIQEESSDRPYFIHYKRYLVPGQYRLEMKTENGNGKAVFQVK